MAEVYVEGKRLDVFEGFKFSFNYSIADIRHPEKRTTSYSKTIQCPGTQNNDNIFGQIYDFNIANAYDSAAANIEVNFNPNKKAEASVQADGVEVMRGSLQLRKIKNRKTDYVYEVVFVGRLVDIFGVLGDKQLSGSEFDEATGTNIPYIDFSDLDHFYNQANQTASWTAPYGSGYVYPMLDYGEDVSYGNSGYRIWFVENLKPALYLKEIVDRIFAFAGFTYTSSFLSSAFFKRLIVPLQDLRQTVDENDNRRLFKAVKTQWQSVQGTYQPTGGYGNEDHLEHWYPIDSGGVYIEGYSKPNMVICYDNDTPPVGYDYGTMATFGNYLNPVIFDGYQPYDYAWQVESSNQGTYLLEATALILFQERYNGQLIQDKGVYQFSGDIRIVRSRNGIHTEMATESFSFTVGECEVPVTGTPPFEQQAQNIYVSANVVAYQGDRYWVELHSPDPDNGGYNQWFRLYNPTNVIDGDFVHNIPASSLPSDWYEAEIYITDGYFRNTYTNEGLQEGEYLNFNPNVPNVAMSDILLSVINMFNLYVLPDPDNDKNLLIETRDDFYEAGGVKDWTHKLDHANEVTVEPLALLTANEYEYTYKEDSDYYNERYQDTHGHAYGRARVDVDNDFLNNTNTTEVIFSPTPLVNDGPTNRIIGKIYDSDIEEGAQPTDHNIRVLYYGGMLDSNPGWTHASRVDTWNDQLLYPYAGHLTHPIAPAQDINFGIPNELFYSANTLTGTLLYTNDNLFNRYHRRGLLEVTNKDSKLLTAYFYLEPLDILKLDFRDQIVIDNSYWRINRILDYNPFGEDLTKVELFKVILKEELKAEKFTVGSGGTIGGGSGSINEKRPINKRRLKNGNQSPLFGGLVKGSDNKVEEGVTGFLVQGDRNKVKSYANNVTIIGNDNTVEEGVTRVRLINTNGVTVTESGTTYINNVEQTSSEVLEGGEDTVRSLNGGTNIFTVDGGEDIVQAQFSETSIYIVEGNGDTGQ